MRNTTEFEIIEQTPCLCDGHTPGPWEIGSVIDQNGGRSISGKGWRDFARVTTIMSGDIEECKDGIANANLIASAPDLLENLEAMVLHLKHFVKNHDYVPIVKAKAAIAKARGIK